MTLYRHLVVGTDFSSNAEKALNEAVYLTIKYGARLSIVHVIDERISQYSDMIPLPPSEMEEMLLQETRRILNEQLSSIDIDTISYEAHVIFGEPYRELIQYAKSEDADLLIIGQKNVPLFKQILLGSTAEKLLRHTPIPLMIVHQKKVVGRYKTLLVPVDFSETSKAALDYAISIAKEEGAEITVLHVWEESPLLSLAGLLPLGDEQSDGLLSSFEKKQRENLDKFIAQFDYPKLKPMIKGGAPAVEIVRCAEELSVDLIIIGSIGKTGIRGMLLGNTAERVARVLPCSILLNTYERETDNL